MNNLSKAKVDHDRVNKIMGRDSAVVPNTTINRSRDRLIRAQTGLLYLLENVIPNLADPVEQEEIFLWVNGVFTITQIEECESLAERKV